MGMRYRAAAAVVVVVVQVGMVHTPPPSTDTHLYTHTHTRTRVTRTPDTDGIRRASTGSRGGGRGGHDVCGEEGEEGGREGNTRFQSSHVLCLPLVSSTKRTAEPSCAHIPVSPPSLRDREERAQSSNRTQAEGAPEQQQQQTAGELLQEQHAQPSPPFWFCSRVFWLLFSCPTCSRLASSFFFLLVS